MLFADNRWFSQWPQFVVRFQTWTTQELRCICTCFRVVRHLDWHNRTVYTSKIKFSNFITNCVKFAFWSFSIFTFAAICNKITKLNKLVLLFVALWFILRGDLLYLFPCVILFLCFSVLLVLRLPRLGKRELILVLFVRFFGLCLFGFVGFLFLLGSGKGCDLWLWHSLDFSLTFFFFFFFFKLPGTLKCMYLNLRSSLELIRGQNWLVDI